MKKRTIKKTKKANTVGQYLGGDDPSQWIWSNRTHSTASEAFRDANYATAFWKCKTEWERTREYLGWGAMWVVVLGLMYLFMTGFNQMMG